MAMVALLCCERVDGGEMAYLKVVIESEYGQERSGGRWKESLIFESGSCSYSDQPLDAKGGCRPECWSYACSERRYAEWFLELVSVLGELPLEPAVKVEGDTIEHIRIYKDDQVIGYFQTYLGELPERAYVLMNKLIPAGVSPWPPVVIKDAGQWACKDDPTWLP